MNPDLDRLQPYPFEKLRGLFKDTTPNPALSAIALAIGEPKHPTPPLIIDAMADNLGAPPASVPAPARSPQADWRLPDEAELRALDELVSLGYYRGIVRKLDDMAALHAGHAGFVNHLRGMAHQFQLDAMACVIQQALLDRQTQR